MIVKLDPEGYEICRFFLLFFFFVVLFCFKLQFCVCVRVCACGLGRTIQRAKDVLSRTPHPC